MKTKKVSSKEERKQRGANKEQVVFPQADFLVHLPSDYTSFITDLKNTIATQRVQTILKANNEMVLLYWNIGFAILEKQSQEKWGTKVIDRMSYDLKVAFPEMSGFSPRNLKYPR
jgi:predicted nuclease of restriction endonuclease-like (RecB) superfamily